MHKEPKLKELDVKGEHVIHPYSFSDTTDERLCHALRLWTAITKRYFTIWLKQLIISI